MRVVVLVGVAVRWCLCVLACALCSCVRLPVVVVSCFCACTKTGSLGQRFLAERPKGSVQREKYQTLAGQQGRAAFRAKWSTLKLQQTIKEKPFCQDYRVVDTEKGTHLPYEVIVQKEGGAASATARTASMLYIDKCLKMLGAWVSFNAMTERAEFLYIQKIHKESFTQAWSTYTTERSKSGEQPSARAPAATAATAVPPASARRVAPNDPEVPVATPAKRKDLGDGENKEKGTVAKQRKQLSHTDKLLQHSTKVKGKYHGVMSGAATLVANIEAGMEDWSWADNPVNVGKLKEFLNGLRSKVDVFGNEILAKDAEDLKQSEETELPLKLENFVALGWDIQAVEMQMKKLLAAHKAMKNVT